MRMFIFLATSALFSTAAYADTYSNEQRTYRHGGTYKVTGAVDVESCAVTCRMEQICKAWSFQRETPGLGPARCELKNTIGRMEENPLMTSGISPRLSEVGVAGRDTSDELLGGAETASAHLLSASTPIITSQNIRVEVTEQASGL